MIEMEVREHDRVDLLRRYVKRRERVRKRRRALDRVDLTAAGVPLVSQARLDQDGELATADEEAIGRDRDAVLRVGGELSFPEHFRDYAEHRSAIQPEVRVANDVDPKRAEAHGRMVERVVSYQWSVICLSGMSRLPTTVSSERKTDN
jgi:hypothetical protein